MEKRFICPVRKTDFVDRANITNCQNRRRKKWQTKKIGWEWRRWR
jgi:hypothetical protein